MEYSYTDNYNKINGGKMYLNGSDNEGEKYNIVDYQKINFPDTN